MAHHCVVVLGRLVLFFGHNWVRPMCAAQCGHACDSCVPALGVLCFGRNCMRPKLCVIAALRVLCFGRNWMRLKLCVMCVINAALAALGRNWVWPKQCVISLSAATVCGQSDVHFGRNCVRPKQCDISLSTAVFWPVTVCGYRAALQCFGCSVLATTVCGQRDVLSAVS